MLKKMDLQDLKTLSKEELTEEVSRVKTRKEALENLKSKSSKSWNQGLQDELTEIDDYVIQLETLLQEDSAVVTDTDTDTEEVSGQEEQEEYNDKLIRLRIVKGRRFNPNTGEEESFPYKQTFTYSEWRLFKTNFSRLGFSIVDVISDPYGEAKDFVTK
jgi:hypothetical protein